MGGWVFPDERTRSDSATGTTTNTVGTNTGVTALQQLRFLVSTCLVFNPCRFETGPYLLCVAERWPQAVRLASFQL